MYVSWRRLWIARVLLQGGLRVVGKEVNCTSCRHVILKITMSFRFCHGNPNIVSSVEAWMRYKFCVKTLLFSLLVAELLSYLEYTPPCSLYHWRMPWSYNDYLSSTLCNSTYAHHRRTICHHNVAFYVYIVNIKIIYFSVSVPSRDSLQPLLPSSLTFSPTQLRLRIMVIQ